MILFATLRRGSPDSMWVAALCIYWELVGAAVMVCFAFSGVDVRMVRGKVVYFVVRDGSGYLVGTNGKGSGCLVMV